ncbi:ATP-binding protein [Sedimentibacter sp.]|uniref:sensor histidine kinase n=1 Tax=Sedimentibacter sp. TaxID=1960295 RepID=UPI0028A8CFB4|nr:ATP-binding protein [Sedimentibacter sp.]
MKRRLFLIILLISFLSSSVVSIITSKVYYDLYAADAKNQIQTILKLTKEESNWEDNQAINLSVNEILGTVNYSIRFTIVDIDGNVVYDSRAKNEALENHKDRPEIKSAFQHGSGEYIRYSDTISTDMYYYAEKINENEVLRLSREISSINKVFINILPLIIFLFIALFVVVYICANIFIKKILKPINLLAGSINEITDNNEHEDVYIYEELEPIYRRFRDQKLKINHYINELKYERDTINTITDNMKEGFILLNRDKNILSINKSGKKMIGNEKFDLYNDRNIIELTRNNNILSKIDLSFKENKHIVYDLENEDSHFRYYLSPVIDQDSLNVTGMLILIENITITKNAEIIRSEFSANVSHELKTPLTTIIGFAELIKEGFITDMDSIRKYSSMINNEGLRLISLIEDIMRLSKIEENPDENENTTINLKDVLNKVVSLLQGKAEDLNINLSFEATDIYMKANHNYISELFYNLIDNAIKYNKENGSVIVKVYKKDGFIIISVKDTGVGIAKEHQQRIFERFYRVDKSRSKQTGGTGLGLSIVKHIAELYEGQIEVESIENEGAEITIKFPQ